MDRQSIRLAKIIRCCNQYFHSNRWRLNWMDINVGLIMSIWRSLKNRRLRPLYWKGFVSISIMIRICSIWFIRWFNRILDCRLFIDFLKVMIIKMNLENRAKKIWKRLLLHRIVMTVMSSVHRHWEISLLNGRWKLISWYWPKVFSMKRQKIMLVLTSFWLYIWSKIGIIRY